MKNILLPRKDKKIDPCFQNSPFPRHIGGGHVYSNVQEVSSKSFFPCCRCPWLYCLFSLNQHFPRRKMTHDVTCSSDDRRPTRFDQAASQSKLQNRLRSGDEKRNLSQAFFFPEKVLRKDIVVFFSLGVLVKNHLKESWKLGENEAIQHRFSSTFDQKRSTTAICKPPFLASNFMASQPTPRRSPPHGNKALSRVY